MTWKAPAPKPVAENASGFVAPIRKMGRPRIKAEKATLIDNAKRDVRFGMDIALAAQNIHKAYFGNTARTEHGLNVGQLKYLRKLIRA